MKYIIEIEDEPYFSGGKTVYRMSGAHVYFSEGQFEKLTPYAESDTADQAWKIAQCILKDPGKDGMLNGELNDCFGTDDVYLIGEMSYAEVKSKYDAWQKLKDELQIGDEVKHDKYGRCVLLEKRDLIGAELWHVIDGTGKVCQINRRHIIGKTGRTFPEVADLLEKMRNPNADH